MSNTVLDLTAEKAKDFFLQEKNYCSVPLPEYFKFGNLLNVIDNQYSQIKKIYKTKTIYPSGLKMLITDCAIIKLVNLVCYLFYISLLKLPLYN